MGIFDFITVFTGSAEKKTELYARKIRNKDTPVEERENIAIWLAEEGSHKAVLALLGRFEMTYEHQMKDQNEKAHVERLLVSLGDRAVEPLRDFLTRSQSFARPLRIYERLTSEESTKDLVITLLEAEAQGSELKPKKKIDLLLKLAEYRGEDVAESALGFLDDFNGDCRYAAVEVLVVQPETEAIRDALLEALANPDEESGRIRHKIAQTAASRGWALGERGAAIGSQLPDDFALAGDRVVAAS